jgi:DNA-binding HxlR family transcriptional regulator
VPERDGGRKQRDDRRRQRLVRTAGCGSQCSQQSRAVSDFRVHLQCLIDVRHLVSGEWSWDVLAALLVRPAQYGDLLAAIQDVAIDNRWPGRYHRRLRDATLTRTLRRLEQCELVERVRESEFPYHTTYHISGPARELLCSMIPVVKWTEQHQALVTRAQHRRHQEQSERD